MASVNDVVASLVAPGVQLNTRALSSSTANAGELTPQGGSGIVIMTNTGGTPGTYTTRTLAQMVADGLQPGQNYLLILANNQGTGVLTLAAGSGVTAVAGTATVAINTARLFTVSVGGTIASPTITITGLALAWTSAV